MALIYPASSWYMLEDFNCEECIGILALAASKVGIAKEVFTGSLGLVIVEFVGVVCFSEVECCFVFDDKIHFAFHQSRSTPYSPLSSPFHSPSSHPPSSIYHRPHQISFSSVPSQHLTSS